ncbi:N-acetylmuramoyl-L-alanine amidase [Evansella vedderi]|uniref:N-acetylmuramoyl-L-alanine amidase n=1 Tax=Evansella vedderi TaxID=38282 RepID=A0ABU0A4R2_9BACI|nr:cell wall hydrolase [Evansella vedderi]MDQ0257663.1 N-acetylmuramoyl-L-alanine amidase [Evansella vedderi]
MRNSTKAANKRLCIIISMFIYVTLLLMPQPAGAFSDQIIQKGATGDDVVELQARLQWIGFYDGNIDGVFGWGTYWAVRNYQQEFGMEVTGLVGENTKAMLERSTEFDKEWVHQMIREGRKFTYYGGTPLDIQKGPKGSRDKKGDLGAQQGGTVEKAPVEDQPDQDTGQAPQEGTPQGTPDQVEQEQPEPQQPAEEQPAPEQAPQQPEEAPQEDPPAEQAPQETPEVPVPEEEEVVEQDDDIDVQSAINVPNGFSDNDIRIMAQAVNGEARGEPFVGQVAVAAVILNRVNSPLFPNTVTGVIFEPGAFCAVADGQIWLEPNETSRKAVLDAINGQDPTGNALYFFNPATATSSWIWSRPQTKQIGKHIFAK